VKAILERSKLSTFQAGNVYFMTLQSAKCDLRDHKDFEFLMVDVSAHLC